MVNHVRTLLLNRDGVGPPVAPWDEFTPTDFKAVVLDPTLRAVHNALLGINVDRRVACWRLKGVMTAVHMSSLASWATYGDPRLSYDPETPQTVPMNGIEAEVEAFNNAPGADLSGQSALRAWPAGSASWLVSLLTRRGSGGEVAFDIAPFDAWLPPHSDWSTSALVATSIRPPITISPDTAPGGVYTVDLAGGLSLAIPSSAPSRSIWAVRTFVPPTDGPVECLDRVEQSGGVATVMSGPGALLQECRSAWSGRDDVDRLASAALALAARIDDARRTS